MHGLLTHKLPFVRLDITPDFPSRFVPAARVLSPAGALSFPRLDLYLTLYLLDSSLISLCLSVCLLYKPHLSSLARHAIEAPRFPPLSLVCPLHFAPQRVRIPPG